MGKPSNKPCDDKRKGSDRREDFNPNFGKEFVDNPLGNDGYHPKMRASKQDWHWYASSEDILKDIANYPFSDPIGEHIDALARMDEKETFTGNGATPGIAIIEYQPSYGRSKTAQDALSRAAQQEYTFMTQGYTTPSSKYEAPDLFCYETAVIELFRPILEGKRAYGAMKKFSNYNQYLAKTLVEALGFDYADLKKNMADFRSELNLRLDEISDSFHVPQGSNILERMNFISSRIYSDGLGKKFQMYAYKSQVYLTYEATKLNTGTCIYRNGRKSVMTVSEYFAMLDSMIAKLRADTDVATMSGDILRAYGNDGVIKTEHLSEDYTVDIEYNPVALMQIHNADIVGTVGFQNTVDSAQNPSVVVFQEDNVVKSIPCGYPGIDQGVRNYLFMNEKVLDVDVETPTPADVIDSTRLMNAIVSQNGFVTLGGASYIEINPGLEIIADIAIYSYTKAYDPATAKQELELTVNKITANYVLVTTDNTGTTPSFDTINKLRDYVGLSALLSRFDWAPKFGVIMKGSQGVSGVPANSLKIVGVAWDLSNFTTISNHDVAKMNNRTWYGVLKVREIGRAHV